MDTTTLLVKIGKKIVEKIGLLGNQKPNPKFSITRTRVPKIFGLGYGSSFADLNFGYLN